MPDQQPAFSDAELAGRLRSKYPGVYDQVPDQQLAAGVKTNRPDLVAELMAAPKPAAAPQKPIVGFQGVTKSVFPRAEAALDERINAPSGQPPLPEHPGITDFLRRASPMRAAANIAREGLDMTTSPLSLLLGGTSFIGREMPMGEVLGPVARALQQYRVSRPVKPIGDLLEWLGKRESPAVPAAEATAGKAAAPAAATEVPAPAAPTAPTAVSEPPFEAQATKLPTPPLKSVPPAASSTVPTGFNGGDTVARQARAEAFDRVANRNGMAQNVVGHTPASTPGPRVKLSAPELLEKSRELSGSTPRADAAFKTTTDSAAGNKAFSTQVKEVAADVGGKGGPRPLRVAASDAINERLTPAEQYAGIQRVAEYAKKNPWLRPADLVSGQESRKRLLKALADYEAKGQ